MSSEVSCDCSCDDCEQCIKCNCADEIRHDAQNIDMLRSMLGSLGGFQNSGNCECSTSEGFAEFRNTDGSVMTGCEKCIKNGTLVAEMEDFMDDSAAIEVRFITKK